MPHVRRQQPRRRRLPWRGLLRYPDTVEIREAFVVHYAGADVLRRCLQSFARHAPGVSVTVLDTGTETTTRDVVLEHDATSVRHVRTPNHSYAASVNAAASLAHTDTFLVTNADAFVTVGTLDALAAPFHDPRVAMTGPLAVDRRGTRQRFGVPYDRWIRAIDGLGDEAVVRVPWLAGHMLAIRARAHADVAGWDENLRFTNEDVDAGLRLRGRGWHCVLVGHTVVHLGGHATPDADRFFVEGLRGGLIVSVRHAPRWFAWLHRSGLFAFATVASRVAPVPRRPRWQALARMAGQGVMDDPPFGSTLDEDADGFPSTWPRSTQIERERAAP